MSPYLRVLWQVWLRFEDQVVHQILRSPAFHRGVRKVHRKVEDIRYGRDPLDPLRPGEATAEPGKPGFLKHFIDELKNQAKGTPTNPPPPPRSGPPMP
ncbi:hypothetical protein B0H63DRAFT_472533 [Podospora didyma]|uniref:Uncharacterized protein n=1 Tax=Podospora didyma TaxID=330526 RepID=A0AAE0TZM0_9PEZI|nr:hypothetical protein B0H63DRAFT_472533 [Podospora didyma]